MPNNIETDEIILQKSKDYCTYYNLPFSHLVEIMSDLKVIPMLRGKGFEYIVSDKLIDMLSSSNWEVSNPNINAQSEIHDVDVFIHRRRDNREVRIECKLSKKDSFRINNSNPEFSVKCMRSRTISDNDMATRMAERYSVSREQILFHADNYRDDDFNFVITSMGNAFWVTEDKRYTFGGTNDDLNELKRLFPTHFSDTNMDDFKQKVFCFLLIARSEEIRVSVENNIRCTRRRCIENGTSTNCGFIPNYPIVNLQDVATGRAPWKILSDLDLDAFLNNFLDQRI